MPKKDGYERTFIQFATSLQKPIDLSQFSKIDSNTISWTKQPRYDGAHMYITITLSANDASFTSYRFRLDIQSIGNPFYGLFIGKTPQECVDKLNMEIDDCVAQENAKMNIWEQYGF